MIKILRKSKIVVLAAVLVCALAFLLNYLATRATPSTVREGANNLSTSEQVKEIKGYRTWTKVNPTPQLMPERVSIACAIWISKDGVIIDGESNPHRDKYFTVHVNEVGQRAMLSQKSPKFPEGSVIVKEKLPTRDSQSPELLTVMIKRKRGFNPASGDWEYMVVNGTGTKVEGRGRLENCQSCHVAYQKTDYVFRTYLPDGVASKLK